MNFINPIEILNLEDSEISTIDSSTIKKCKRRLLTDIELSDEGLLEYHKFKFTRSECEKVIDQLEISDDKEFYYFLAKNVSLNHYLINGDESFFSSFQQESIFSLTAFQTFIAPYFVPKFDKSILSAVKKNEQFKVAAILRAQVLIPLSQFTNAFKSLSIELDARIVSIQEITRKIKNKDPEITKESIQSILSTIKVLFPVKVLNVLPDKVFQSLINKIAVSVNYLQLAIDNELGDSDLSLALLEYILELQISSVSMPTFMQNRDILKRRKQLSIEREQNAPVLKKWAQVLNDLNKLRNDIEKKVVNTSSAVAQINELLDLINLNKLASFADEVREEIALALRELSVSVWNSYYDIENALIIVKMAHRLQINASSKKFIEETINQLEGLKEKRKVNEKAEIEDIIKVLVNINNQISVHGMIHMKSDKIKALLNEIFTNQTVDMLAASQEQLLRRRLFEELERMLVKLDAFYSNNFFRKLKPLGNNDGELALKIQNGISGIGFVSKNVANNLGTGLGKANKAMVNNLPSQLVGYIYILIVVAIIGGICSLLGC